MITAKNFWVWFGGIWFAIGALFLVIGVGVGVNHSRLDGRFAADGRTAQGEVLGKEISTSSDSSAKYRVTFRYSGERGENIRGTAELSPDAWEALVERGPIEITYLPDRPRSYRVQGQRDSDAVLSFVFGGAGGVLALVGGFLLVTALRTLRRNRELESTGLLAAATVTDLAPGNVRINGVPQWKLRYRYRDSLGHTYDGSCTLSAGEAQSWKQGADGRVRYAQDNPRSHVWIGSG